MTGKPPEAEKHTKVDLPVRRCRAWAWYCSVVTKGIRDGDYDVLRDDKMDLKLSWSKSDPKPDERLRLFAQIRRLGSDPGVVHKKSGRQRVVDEIEKRYPNTRRIYESVLWDLLVPPAKPHHEIEGIISKLANARGLHRLTQMEVALGRALYPRSATFRAGTEPNGWYHKTMETIAESADIDDLALLCALYREAVYSFSLAQAKVLMTMVLEASANVAYTLELADDARILFDAMIQRRVLANNWTSTSAPEFVAIVRSRYTKMKEIRSKALIERRIQYHALLLESTLDQRAALPWVVPDKKIKRQLETIKRKLGKYSTNSSPEQALLELTAQLDPDTIQSIETPFSPIAYKAVDIAP